MAKKATKRATKRTPKAKAVEAVETPAPVDETAEKGAMLRFRSNGL